MVVARQLLRVAFRLHRSQKCRADHPDKKSPVFHLLLPRGVALKKSSQRTNSSLIASLEWASRKTAVGHEKWPVGGVPAAQD